MNKNRPADTFVVPNVILSKKEQDERKELVRKLNQVEKDKRQQVR